MGPSWFTLNVDPINASGAREYAVAAAALVLLAGFFSFIFLRRLLFGPAKLGPFPLGPPGSPILGNWHLLRTGSAREKLTQLASSKAYDHEIIGLRIGWRPTVVVSSARMAKEILQTHDRIFANRPAFHFSNTLFYGFDSGVIFSGYTPRFARLRKLYTLELFSAKRLQELQFIRLEEMRRVVDRLRRLEACSPQPALNVEKLASDMSCDVTLRLLQSRSLGEKQGPELNELVRMLEHSSAPTLGDFVPWLKWLGLLQKAKVGHLRNKFDVVINTMIRERRELIKNTPTPDQLPRDFLQVLLSEESAQDEEERLTITDIKAIILDIFAGGIHTSSVTVEWAMSELIANPRVMEKLRAEIHELKGAEDKEGLVTDEDVGNLPYLEAVVKEVFRLHPVVPLLVPRISTQACSVGKYVLPEGTQAFVNVWAIARDPEIWQKAEEFWPERFDGQDLDVKGQHYELLPFGSGRRICPGMRLGLSLVHLTVANLVRFFDWHLPPGHALDLAEKVGRGNAKATRLFAIPTPRLH